MGNADHTLIAAAAILATQEEAHSGGLVAEVRQRLEERLLWWIERLGEIDTVKEHRG